MKSYRAKDPLFKKESLDKKFNYILWRGEKDL